MEDFGVRFKARHPFVTGSQEYGKPGPDSDIDLVIFMPKSFDCKKLEAMSDKCGGDAYDDVPKHQTQMRFGKLNLIVVHTDKAYTAWEAATRCALNFCFGGTHGRNPLSKDRAKRLFRRVFAKLGLETYHVEKVECVDTLKDEMRDLSTEALEELEKTLDELILLRRQENQLLLEYQKEPRDED